MFENVLKALLNIELEPEAKFYEEEHVPGHRFDPPNKTYEISNRLSEKDNDFSVDDMLSYAEMIFREVHKAVTFQDLDPIKSLVSPRLYAVLKELISDNKIDAIEEYSFDSIIEKNYLTHYKIDDKFENEYLTVCLIMNIPSNDVYYINRLEFRRTVQKSRRMGIPVTRAISCPNCGAALKSVIATRCDYCNSLIEPATYEWLLMNFEIVKR